MNKIGENQCRDILDSFAWDSTGYEESAGVRAREREDSHIFYFRDWFNIVTKRGLAAERNMLITYQRGLAPKINKFEEPGNVSLCARDRDLDNNGGSKKVTKNCSSFIRKAKKKQLKDKPVKKQTYLGEEYARESLYETIEDCLADGEELIIDESKSIEAQIVIDYLKYLELEGQIINLLQQGAVLDKEANALNQKIISLIQELDGLKNQYTALQNQRKDLQSQQNKLQEFQNQLLR